MESPESHTSHGAKLALDERCCGSILTNLNSKSQKDPTNFKNKVQHYLKEYNKVQPSDVKFTT